MKSNFNQIKNRMIILPPTVQAGLERECTIKDFEVLGLLGEGGFGQVFQVLHKQTKRTFALKKVPKQKLRHQTLIDQMNIEIKIMYELDHDNIIKLYNHFEDEESIYLVLECAEEGQLYTKLKNSGRLHEKIAQKYVREMVSAIDYCHSRNPPIIHRDIKPENILIDKEGNVKLADFGWSNFINPGSTRNTYAGTTEYLAPEMIEDKGHGLALDYWCIGVLIYELLTGKAPFTVVPAGLDQRQVEQIIMQNVMKGKIEYPKDFPPLAKDLVNKLLKKDPEQRIKIDEIKQHPWIKLDKPRSSLFIRGSQEPEFKQPSMSPQENKPTNIANLEAHSNQKQPQSGQSSPSRSSPKKGEGALEWTEEELRNFTSMRPNSILNATEENESTEDQSNKDNESKNLFQRFSVSYSSKPIGNDEIINELNSTIKDLKNQVRELEVKVKLGERDADELRKEVQRLRGSVVPSFDMSTPEGKKIKILEEEKKRLKAEIDEILQKTESQEVELQRKNQELKKLDELKNAVAAYKNEKGAVSKQLKEAQAALSQAQTKIRYLQDERDEERQKYEKMLKEKDFGKGNESFAANEQEMLKNLVEFARSSMEEMQKKLDHYKEKSDNIEKLQAELDEKNVRLYKLDADLQEKVNETRRVLEEQFDKEKSELEKEHQANLEKTEARFKELVQKLENEVNSMRKQQSDKGQLEATLESLEAQVKTLKIKNDTLNETCMNLQTLKDRDEKRIKLLSTELEDYRIRNDMMKTQYSQLNKQRSSTTGKK